jgi:hypothetical protein
MVYASQVATVATVTAGIWDAVATSYDDAGSMGALLNDAGAAGDPWSVDLPGSYTGLDAGAILSQINVNMSSTVIAVASVRANMAYASTTNTINTNVSSAITWIASVHTNLVTVDGLVDTINSATGTTIPNLVTTVKVDTASTLAYVDNIASVQVAVDNLTINGAQASLLLTQTQINAQVLSALDTQDIVQASEMASLSGADVWNAMASTYDTAGTLGEALNNASAAGDPWATDLPGSYTGIQAGAMISTVNVNTASNVVAIASVRANMGYASTETTILANTTSTIVNITSVLTRIAEVKVDTASTVVAIASVLANYAQASTVTGVAQASILTTVKVETASMLAKIDIIDTVADAIKVDTASTVVAISSALAKIDIIDTATDEILLDTGSTLDTKIDNIKVETASTLARIVALNNISAADVNAQVVDALNVDTYAEPGQEAPAATNTLAKKISYLFKALRNKITQTSTTTSIYNDAGDTVDQKATVTDDATTFTRGKFGTGA